MFLSVRTSWWGESPKEILSRTTAFYQGILPRVLNSKSSFCSPSTLLPLPTLLVQNGKLPVSVLADIFCRNAWRQLRKPEASHAFFRFDRRRKHCGSHQNEPRQSHSWAAGCQSMRVRFSVLGDVRFSHTALAHLT